MCIRDRSASNSSIETVQDMKRFIEQYPEFQRLRGNVSKHVALLGELSQLVDTHHLLEVSELEQSLASNENHTTDLRNVQTLIGSERIRPDAKLRLAMLYALRYQKWSGNRIDAVVQQLIDAGVQHVALVYVMLNLCGAEQRQDDLFANENILARGKSALKGLKGVDNVYTQHTPHHTQPYHTHHTTNHTQHTTYHTPHTHHTHHTHHTPYTPHTHTTHPVSYTHLTLPTICSV